MNTIQWNPALRPLFWPPDETAIHFLVKKSLVNMVTKSEQQVYAYVSFLMDAPHVGHCIYIQDLETPQWVLCSDWFSWIQKSRSFQSKAKTYPPNPELSGFMTPTHNMLPIAASTAEPPFLIKSNPTSAHSFTSDTTAAWPIEKIK